MDMSNICKLVKKTYTTDQYGVRRETETEKEVFCQIQSVTGTEWHNAGRNGIRAEQKVTLFKYDYSDEIIVKLDGKRYEVYRTYDRGDDYFELYLKRGAGA